MPKNLTPKEVRAFLMGDAAPQEDTWPRRDNPLAASEGSGGDYLTPLARLPIAATDKARRLGWRVNPETYDEKHDPHAHGELCNCKHLRTSFGVCTCICHGVGGARRYEPTVWNR